MIIRKSAQEIEGMARAGELVHETLQLVADQLDPGVTMTELDRIADEHIASKGGHPTSKGYKGFPAALCISPNSMVVHGIPSNYRAQEGDLISVDLGVTLDGLVADSAVTLPVGEITAEAQRLLDVCQEALDAMLDEIDRALAIVLLLELEEAVCRERLLLRAQVEQRPDDTPEAIQRRLELYERETAPLVEYYRSTRGNVVGIHADRAIEDVFHEVAESLDQVQARA